MNRAIKFRCWDKESKKWLNSDSFCGHYDDFYFTNLNEIISELNGINNMVLMQFTGLKDKNDKDIFEGDIVDIGHELYNFEIVFSEGCFGLLDRTARLIPFWQINMHNIEVIGNVWENPELLN